MLLAKGVYAAGRTDANLRSYSTAKSVSDCGSPYREKLRTAGSKPGTRTGSMLASWPIVDTAQPACSSSSETEQWCYINILHLRKMENY